MKRILIIDDEKRICQLYTSLLMDEGFKVRSASGATEAIGLLIREHFDLVLLDINMPRVDGKATYEVVREFDPHMKVIVSSVHPVEEQIQSILGASAYHEKVQGVDMLIVKVKEVLKDEQAQNNPHS